MLDIILSLDNHFIVILFGLVASLVILGIIWVPIIQKFAFPFIDELRHAEKFLARFHEEIDQSEKVPNFEHKAKLAGQYMIAIAIFCGMSLFALMWLISQLATPLG